MQFEVLHALRRAALCCALAVAGPAPATEVPAEAFFQNGAFTRAVLSPSGRYLAVGVTPKGARTRLVVMDTATLKGQVAKAFDDADIGFFEWVDDARLVFTGIDRQSAPRNDRTSGGLYAVQRDGREYKPLSWPGGSLRFHSTTRRKDSEDIFVTRRVKQGKAWTQTLHRISSRTGTGPDFTGPGQVFGWMQDQDDQPRIAFAAQDDLGALRYLDPQSRKWEVLPGSRVGIEELMVPVGMAADGNMYVSVRGASDKYALHRYDLAKRQLDPEPLFTLADYDFEGGLVEDAEHLLGVRYLSDARATLWFDPRMKDVQARVDKLLPGTVNLIQPPERPKVPIVLVFAYSDVDPGRFLLFDTSTGKLTEIGSRLRGIDPKQMATMDLAHYKARDGLSIPAWLTLPRGGQGRRLPLVVMVHGGPYLRGEWEWRAATQFLASRGYAVLEPEFRGSAGFGAEHTKKSVRQWGLAMQDDIADGVLWAIEKGIADPARICIGGSNYGGYSTLMGLVRNPELFKCGVAWASITDIGLMFDEAEGDWPSDLVRFGVTRLIGDPEEDAEQLQATSPLAQAARITQPLLLAHGGVDGRVSLEQGVKFRKAVRQTNFDVEWVEYPDEGHGWRLVDTRVDFWTRVEKFLEKNIGRSAREATRR